MPVCVADGPPSHPGRRVLQDGLRRAQAFTTARRVALTPRVARRETRRGDRAVVASTCATDVSGGSMLASTSPRAARRGATCTLALFTVLACVLLPPPAASAADFTWSGASPTSVNWSDPANWYGGAAPAPGASIANLTFQGCSGGTSTPACQNAHNDVPGLTVNHLNAGFFNDPTVLDGLGITLGA